jgi:hypothetical protein
MANLSSILTSGTPPTISVINKNQVLGLLDSSTPKFNGITLDKMYQFESDNVSGYKDMHGQISNRPTGLSAPGFTNIFGNMWGYEFTGNQLKETWLEYHPDHDFKDGSAFYPHVHIIPKTTGLGTVTFGFEYTIAKGYDQGIDSFFNTTTNTVYATYDITTNSQYKHIIIETTLPITDPLFEIDSICLIRVFRNGSADTYAGSVYLLRCDLHYESNKESTINKNFPFYS